MKSNIQTSLAIVFAFVVLGGGMWALLRSVDQAEVDDVVADHLESSAYFEVEDGTILVGMIRIQVDDKWGGIDLFDVNSLFVAEYTDSLDLKDGVVTNVWRFSESSGGEIGGVQNAVITVYGDKGVEQFTAATAYDGAVMVNTDTEYTFNNISWIASGHLICFASAGSCACIDPQWYGVDGSDREALGSLLKQFSQSEPSVG